MQHRANSWLDLVPELTIEKGVDDGDPQEEQPAGKPRAAAFRRSSQFRLCSCGANNKCMPRAIWIVDEAPPKLQRHWPAKFRATARETFHR